NGNAPRRTHRPCSDLDLVAMSLPFLLWGAPGRSQPRRSGEAPGPLQDLPELRLPYPREAHQERRPADVVIGEVEGLGIELQQDVAVGEVDLDRDGLTILLQPQQELALHVESRRAVRGALNHAGKGESQLADRGPGDAAARACPDTRSGSALPLHALPAERHP